VFAIIIIKGEQSTNSYHGIPLCEAKTVSQRARFVGHQERIKLFDVLKNTHGPHTAFLPEQEQYSPRGVGAVDSRVKALVSARSTQPDGFSQFSHGERLILHSIMDAHNLA